MVVTEAVQCKSHRIMRAGSDQIDAAQVGQIMRVARLEIIVERSETRLEEAKQAGNVRQSEQCHQVASFPKGPRRGKTSQRRDD